MVATLALATENTFQQHPSPDRNAALARYRHLREISRRHHSGALKFLAKEAPLHHARRLGLASGRTILLDSMDELTLAYDLAMYTAPPGRSRAIDRYARSVRLPPGSDEAVMLDAMCRARFAILLVERRHPCAGLIVTDVCRDIELWMMDEGLERSLSDGAVYATRYYLPEGFAMTAGVGMPIDIALLADAVDLVPQLHAKLFREIVDDRRLAEAIYRVAIADGIMEEVSYEDDAGSEDRAL